MTTSGRLRAAFALPVLLAQSPLSAQEAELAQQLANPIAAIISVPFQLNFDDNLGLDDTGRRTTMNFQPVIPFGLDNGANIVTRTIFPYIWQEDVLPGTKQQGLADISFNLWYSDTTEDGLTWGVGPTFLMPTYSDVSNRTWGAGVTGIVLKVAGPWTIGGLANHVWHVESDPDVPISNTFVQPFAAYSTPSAWTYTVSSESTYDWYAEEWSVPMNASVSKLIPVAGVPINWQAGVGHWITSPDGGAEGWRFRLQAQIVIPKK
jgi:hypothetical protein